MTAETFTDPRVPDHAQRVVGWLPISEIKGHDGRVWTFKPANIVFLDGGSLYWFEMPDTLCVMHARGDGEIVRYAGEWSDPLSSDIGSE